MRVLLPLRSFEVREKMDLYEQVKSVNWRSYMPTGRTFAISARVDHPEFKNTLYAAQVCLFRSCVSFAELQLSLPPCMRQ